MQPGHCRAARQGAGRMSRALWRCGAMLAALLALPGAAAAQAGALESQASGLFINAAGQILTAAHAVTGCASLYALKDGRCAGPWWRAMTRATWPCWIPVSSPI